MIRGRRRKVIIEKFSTLQTREHEPVAEGVLAHFRVPPPTDPYRSNNFVVEMENDHLGLYVDSLKIGGFKVTNNTNAGKLLTVRAILDIGEWLENFEKMTIAKIYLLDRFGESIKFFDYDIEMLEHNFNFDYNRDEIMMPTISYKIID